MNAPVRAWHFTGPTLRDGAPIPPVGHKLCLPNPDNLELCVWGYHGSLRPFDALQYAPGNLLHYTEHTGTILYQEDKLCSTERTIIKSMNVEKVLQKFACKQALKVAHLRNVPKVVLDYLNTQNESLRDAAWAAARDAARAVARAAAWDAAWDAASAEFQCDIVSAFEVDHA